MTKRHFILGTAGHIDHGKTALVKQLTGVDTDRLKEEKARGLTIDIGFAHLGDNATIIDVPGHEKFIKNMVAGVSTIDLVLFIVAADDGVMPQTREHLDILELLHVRSGLIVITKIDLVDEEWLQLVEEDVRALVQGTFLEDAPVFRVSSVSGVGVDELQQGIRERLDALPPRHDRGVFWLPVDRSFVMKGFGTVVTGSVLSGHIRVGEMLELLPQGRTVRVRGLQKHGKNVQEVAIGDRAAINLQGISKDEVVRGDVLASPGYFSATSRLHCRLHLLPDAPALRPNTRVRLHLGTAEIMARVTPIGKNAFHAADQGFAQLTLEAAAAARRLDPFVIRQYSPARTIGGGVILDADAKPYRRRDEQLPERLRALEKEDPAELVQEQFLTHPDELLTEEKLASVTGMARATVRDILNALLAGGRILQVSKKAFVHRNALAALQQQITHALEQYHAGHPASPGLRKAEAAKYLPPRVPPPLVQFLLEQMKQAGALRESAGFLALPGHKITLSPELEKLHGALLDTLQSSGFTPPAPEEIAAALHKPVEDIETVLSVLLLEGRVVRLEESIFMHYERVAEAREKLISHLKQHGQITVPQFKDLIAGASRKFALPLLNYFDAQEITLREGDVRYPGAAMEK